MVMYFILHRCDPIPGRFLCENAVEAHHVSKGKVALLSDFYKPSGEESSPKCMYGCSTYPSKTLAIIHKILSILFHVSGPDYKDESKFYQMASY